MGKKKLGIWVFCTLFILSNKGLSEEKTQINNEPFTTKRIPLIDFSNPETRKGWNPNPWGGGIFKVNFIDTQEEKFPSRMVLTLENLKGGTLSNPKLFESISNKWKETQNIEGFYIYCRIKEGIVDAVDFQYVTMDEQTGEKYQYVNRIPLTNEWRCIEIKLGGFRLKGHAHPFNIKELKQIHLVFYNGTAKIEIGEIGFFKRYYVLKGIEKKPEIVYIPKTEEDIFVDGRIDKTEWENASIIDLKLPNPDTKLMEKMPKEKTKFFITWKNDGIYCASICEKSNMKKLKTNFVSDDDLVWQDECVEFYFDIGRTTRKMKKFAINANGKIGLYSEDKVWVNQYQKKRFPVVAKKYTNRWEVECFLPWEILGINLQDSEPIYFGFNATRTTYEGSKIEERSGWTTVQWNAISDFGVGILVPGKNLVSSSIKNIIVERAGSGDYAIKVENLLKERLNYILTIYSSERQICKLNGTIPTGYIRIPFVFPVAQTEHYHLVLILYDSKGLIYSFFEANLPEQIQTSWKRLPADAIAIFPEPKEFYRENGEMKLTDGMTYTVTSPEIEICGEKLEKELKDFYDLKLKKVSEIEKANIIIDYRLSGDVKTLLKRMGLEDKFNKIKYDGFIVTITPEKVLITAKEKRGALYGTNVFLDLIKMSSGDIGPPKVCYATVVDWPDYEIRYWIHHLFGYYPRNKYDPELYCEMLEKIPFRFRYNGLSIELGDYYNWKCAPIGVPQAWNHDDFQKIIDCAYKNFVPVFPKVNSLSHMEWLLRHPEYKFLREDGWPPTDDWSPPYTICTKNPKTYEILFGFYDEYISLLSKNPEFSPKYFHIGLDEAQWRTKAVPPEQRCKYCAGIPKNEIYIEHIHNLTNYLKKKGIIPIIWSDCMVEEHNGYNFGGVLIRDRLPKEIIIAHWSKIDYPAIPRFHKLGIENWKISTGYQVSRLNEDLIKGQGLYICSYYWWNSFLRTIQQGRYGLMAQALYANAIWNLFPDYDDTSWLKYERIYGNFLMKNWSRKPLKGATDEIKTIDISDVVNEVIVDEIPGDGKGWFDLGADYDLSLINFNNIKEIEGIPVKFAKKDGKIACLKFNPYEKKNINIPLRDKIGSLILLHAANLDEKCREYLKGKDPLKGFPIIKYIIKYVDGKEEFFEVLSGWNINNWKINPLDRNEIFSKYVIDARSIFEGHTKFAKNKNLLPDIVLYQYEWANPFPEKEIEYIQIESLGTPAGYALLSISARGVK